MVVALFCINLVSSIACLVLLIKLVVAEIRYRKK